MRMAMMIDLDSCVGCQACASACKEQWDSGRGASRAWVHSCEFGTRDKDMGFTFYPGICMECEDHPCTQDCPTGATWMNANGIVVVDPAVCIGCGNCITMCPYGARKADPEKKIVEKCNLCEPYVARGEQPACVRTCLAGCRIFGDLDDPTSTLSQAIKSRDAKPLVTSEVNPRPKVTYAGAKHRAAIIASGAVKAPAHTWLTKTWDGGSRPFARFAVPGFAAAAVVGGLLVNLRQRTLSPETEADAEEVEHLPRHSAGMRFLHWFNAASWAFLLLTGTALLSTPAFALFGTWFPDLAARFFGGKANLLTLHVWWGVLWSVVIVPFFFIFKRGWREVWEEVRLTRDDLKWFLVKPFALMSKTEVPLPPQDKYNAGQKVFAITALLGTSTIIATGLVMAFHWGGAGTVAVAILLHKLAIALAILGLSVHFTMAAILRSERAALNSMITGKIDRKHAEHHSTKWVAGIQDNDTDEEEK
jgi:formate dehydrogenase gamma subunit